MSPLQAMAAAKQLGTRAVAVKSKENAMESNQGWNQSVIVLQGENWTRKGHAIKYWDSTGQPSTTATVTLQAAKTRLGLSCF